jgi:hypothetical protein
MTGRKGPSVGRNDILKTLLNYVISTFYPQVKVYLSKLIERFVLFKFRLKKNISQMTKINMLHFMKKL